MSHDDRVERQKCRAPRSWIWFERREIEGRGGGGGGADSTQNYLVLLVTSFRSEKVSVVPGVRTYQG